MKILKLMIVTAMFIASFQSKADDDQIFSSLTEKANQVEDPAYWKKQQIKAIDDLPEETALVSWVAFWLKRKSDDFEEEGRLKDDSDNMIAESLKRKLDAYSNETQYVHGDKSSILNRWLPTHLDRLGVKFIRGHSMTSAKDMFSPIR